MYARVVLGAAKSVPFREVSSIQGCPYREVPLYIIQLLRPLFVPLSLEKSVWEKEKNQKIHSKWEYPDLKLMYNLTQLLCMYVHYARDPSEN